MPSHHHDGQRELPAAAALLSRQRPIALLRLLPKLCRPRFREVLDSLSKAGGDVLGVFRA